MRICNPDPFTGWNLQMRKQYWRANGQSVHSMAAGKKAFTYGFSATLMLKEL
jgi:hypothetical protein